MLNRAGLAVGLGLFVLGVLAVRFPALWIAAVVIAVVAAARKWSRGAYDGSGGEVAFSAMVVVAVFILVALGALAAPFIRSQRRA